MQYLIDVILSLLLLLCKRVMLKFLGRGKISSRTVDSTSNKGGDGDPSQSGGLRGSSNKTSSELVSAKIAVCSGQRCSATINTKEQANITMSESNHQDTLLAIEKVLALLRSVRTLEGTDKDGVEHLLQWAVDNLMSARR